ncbi:MAG: hypothetical protein AB8B94_14235 [Hyphomicrobiales bacterium]
MWIFISRRLGALIYALPGVLAIAATGAQAQSFNSGCSAVDLTAFVSINSETGAVEYDEKGLRIFAVDEGAEIYSQPEGTATNGALAFGQALWILDPGEDYDRLQISEEGSQDALGWVERDVVLCRQDPLRDAETGLWRRVYIQTATRSVGSVQDGEGETEIQPKPLFRGPIQDCDDTCFKVGKFDWFFVYGEENNRFLLAKGPSLRPIDSAGVRGWLQSEDGIPWNSSSALRPNVSLDQADPNFLCAYPTLDELRSDTGCREFLGGLRWFEIDLRLPVIDETEEAWQVIFKGGGNNLDREELLSLIQQEQGLNNGREGLNNLDVLFLIDGTKSIKPAIDAIKGGAGRPGLVDQLRTTLSSKIGVGGKFRVGFRVFRDSIPGGSNGVSQTEKLSLSELDCRTDSNDFTSKFRNVQARDEWANDDDFEENIMDGLRVAMSDLKGCDSHVKLVVVIGDHGYSSQKQRERGKQPVTVSKIVRQMRDQNDFKSPPLLFFIQLPKVDLNTIQNKVGYEKAYKSFETLAGELIREQARFFEDPEDPASNAQLRREMSADMFTRLPKGQVTSAVISQIADTMNKYLNPRIVNELGPGGMSVTESIDILRKRSGGVPILWWKMAEQRLCAEAGDQCTENVLDKVDTLFVRKSDAGSLDKDILMTNDQLGEWVNVLRAFRDLPGGQLDKGVVALLTESMEGSLSVQLTESYREDGTKMDLGEFLQFESGLPTGFGSKLLSYSLGDFNEGSNVPFCEVQFLADMAARHIEILEYLKEGDKLMAYDKLPPDPGFCPNTSEKGLDMETIDSSTVRVINLNEAGSTVTRDYTEFVDNKKFYWIPEKYLP